MNDCYLNFLVSFRALFSLDVGANLVNSKQTYMNSKTMKVKATEGKGYLTIKSRRSPKANIGTPEKVSEGVWRLWIDSPEERIVTYHL